MRTSSAVLLSGIALGLAWNLGGCGGSNSARPEPDGGPDATTASDGGTPSTDSAISLDASSARSKVQHVVMIMQENRSFDHYFGMFPGAEGFTLDATGNPTNCNPDPNLDASCVTAYHDPSDKNAGGPHTAVAFAACKAGGKMDGFIKSAEGGKKGCADPTDPACTNGGIDVMGYKVEADIPNYWAYARQFVLQDHLFESDASWSWPMHQYMVSEWAALCSSADPMSCVSNIGTGKPNPAGFYSWTPLTYLLDKAHVSWRYYLSQGTTPDCDDDEMDCPPQTQLTTVPSIWNPLPLFEVVKDAGEQTTSVLPVDAFYKDVAAGTLPAVSWIAPSGEVSEHPPNLVSEGEKYTTALINAIMQSPYWQDTVIFLFWDDWGGFYDHVVPPVVDVNGYGFRTPGLVISAWAKKGYIDHQVLSFDAYVKFVEDVFLVGQRLDPSTDGRKDSRPDVRENAAVLGDLLTDFDFNSPPQQPMVLKLQ